MLYCIHCERMTQEHDGPTLYHLRTVVTGTAPLDVGSFYDVVECPYPDGWAAVSLPPFDMDNYMEEVGEPPFPIDMDFLGYDYDVDSDQIIYEEVI